jgi:hypothetical protein
MIFTTRTIRPCLKTIFTPTRKETTMQYKTTVLGLLQDRPVIYDHLISSRTLLSTLERFAEELRTSHHAWQDRLWLTKPNSDPTQIASEALEIALQELEGRLHSDSPDETETPSLDAAMAFISRPSHPA